MPMTAAAAAITHSPEAAANTPIPRSPAARRTNSSPRARITGEYGGALQFACKSHIAALRSCGLVSLRSTAGEDRGPRKELVQLDRHRGHAESPVRITDGRFAVRGRCERGACRSGNSGEEP